MPVYLLGGAVKIVSCKASDFGDPIFSREGMEVGVSGELGLWVCPGLFIQCLLAFFHSGPKDWINATTVFASYRLLSTPPLLSE